MDSDSLGSLSGSPFSAESGSCGSEMFVGDGSSLQSVPGSRDGTVGRAW